MAGAACAALLVSTGCGGGQTGSSTAERKLQREDLVAVSRALQSMGAPVAHEVTAARAAWPLIANGLPRPRPATAGAAVTAAAAAAGAIAEPQLFGEAAAASLTGPASQLAGQFRTFDGLSAKGWELTAAAIDQIEQGSPAAARFAAKNVALYIDSIYDAHFTLAQIGRQLRQAYNQLGGEALFGHTLTQAQVDALAETYSEQADRLHPHAGVRLGS